MENKDIPFTFFLGEKTVTLEDVELVLGLLVDGEVVTRITSGDLVSLCEHLLRFISPATMVKGNAINLSWLNNTFLFRNCHILQPIMLLLNMLEPTY